MEKRNLIERIVLQPGRPPQSVAYSKMGEGLVVQTPGQRATEQEWFDGGPGNDLTTDGMAVVAWGYGPAMMVGLRELHVIPEVDGLDVTLNVEAWDPVSETANDPARFDFVLVGWDELNTPATPEPFSVAYNHTYPAAGTYQVFVQAMYLPIGGTEAVCNPDHPRRVFNLTVS